MVTEIVVEVPSKITLKNMEAPSADEEPEVFKAFAGVVEDSLAEIMGEEVRVTHVGGVAVPTVGRKLRVLQDDGGLDVDFVIVITTVCEGECSEEDTDFLEEVTQTIEASSEKFIEASSSDTFVTMLKEKAAEDTTLASSDVVAKLEEVEIEPYEPPDESAIAEAAENAEFNIIDESSNNGIIAAAGIAQTSGFCTLLVVFVSVMFLN